MDRHLLLLEGKGLEVRGPESGLCLLPTRDHAVEFSGDLKVEGILREGEVRDFNVFSRRGVFKTEVEIRRLQAPAQAPTLNVQSGIWLLYAPDEALNVQIKTTRNGHQGAASEDANEVFPHVFELQAHEALLVQKWEGRGVVKVHCGASLDGESFDGAFPRMILVQLRQFLQEPST